MLKKQTIKFTENNYKKFLDEIWLNKCIADLSGFKIEN